MTTTAKSYTAERTAALLREGARQSGNRNRQAAVELLIQHDVWLHHRGFLCLINTHNLGDGEVAQIRWGDVRTNLIAVDAAAVTGAHAMLSGGTGSAYRMLRLAFSVAAGELYELLNGFDLTNQALIVNAIARALGNERAQER